MVSEAKDIHRSLFYISHKKRPDVHSCPAGLLLLRTLRWVRDSSVYRRWNGWGCNAFTWGQEVKITLCQLCQHELEIKWLHLSYSVKKYIIFFLNVVNVYIHFLCIAWLVLLINLELYVERWDVKVAVSIEKYRSLSFIWFFFLLILKEISEE